MPITEESYGTDFTGLFLVKSTISKKSPDGLGKTCHFDK